MDHGKPVLKKAGLGGFTTGVKQGEHDIAGGSESAQKEGPQASQGEAFFEIVIEAEFREGGCFIPVQQERGANLLTVSKAGFQAQWRLGIFEKIRPAFGFEILWKIPRSGERRLPEREEEIEQNAGD